MVHDEANKLLRSSTKGEKWARAALPVLVQVARSIDNLKAEMGDEQAPLKTALEEVGAKYKPQVEELETLSDSIRERVMTEYKLADPIQEEGVGTLSFALRYTFRVTDINKVERKYFDVSAVAVNTAIKKGLRKIPGIEINQTRMLRVLKA